VRPAAAFILGAALLALLAGCARHDNAERSALHLPVYPGATAVTVPASIRAQNGGHIIEIFTTWDRFDKVRDWYGGMLPRDAQSALNEANREATYALSDDRTRTVHLEVAGDQVYIYLSGLAAPATGR
jgi:hypothetical protein